MKVIITGNCLNGGQSRVEIITDDKFSLFFHEDSFTPVAIPLNLDNVVVENHLVSLVRPVRVDVVEHLFSALYGLNLYDVRVDAYDKELPFFDGSSKQYTEKLKTLATDNKPETCSAQEKILVSHNSSYLLYEPTGQDRLIIDMELFHPFIGTQKICLEIDEESYISEIAPSRTFAFTYDSDHRLKDLPPYGIGITKDNIYSYEPLRYENEFVRHKILDLLGDLYVIKKKLNGKIVGRNTSHLLNLEFAREFIKRI